MDVLEIKTSTSNIPQHPETHEEETFDWVFDKNSDAAP